MTKSYYLKSKTTGKVFETSCPEYYKDDEPMTKAEGYKVYRQQTIDEFKAWNVKKVYTNVDHVSGSGMQRGVSCYIVQNDEIRCIDRYVQIITERKEHKKGGTVCDGCGMDMAGDLVYNLSARVHEGDRAGYQIKQERI
jgi:hypothetical protein